MRETLTIAQIGHRGDGVAHTPDGDIFLPYVLPGEIVTVEPSPETPTHRRLVAIESPSPQRVAASCTHFGTCGGCALQHWQNSAYRAWKRDLVIGALAQAGISAPVDDLIDAHGQGRRRLVLHARGIGNAVQVGFSAQRAHTIVPIEACPVLAPLLHGAIEAARALADALRPLRKPLDIQITGTDTGLDVDLRGSGPLAPAAQTRLTTVAARHNLARLTRHREPLMQMHPPSLEMGRARVVLPPASFLQATAEGEAVLAGLVGAHVQDAACSADLFAGVGPFALRLAETARVHAVDSDAPAIAALARAARSTSRLKAVTTAARDLFRLPLRADELRDFDAVIFDPPRQGAAAQARGLASSRVPVVVGVACNAATFARDARTLIGGGYRLERVTPVDQFRYSAHVELVGLFRL